MSRKYEQIEDFVPFTIPKKMAKFTHVERNKEFNLYTANWNFKCCDCGLVHNVTMLDSKHKIKIIMNRDNRATAQIRRYKK